VGTYAELKRTKERQSYVVRHMTTQHQSMSATPLTLRAALNYSTPQQTRRGQDFIHINQLVNAKTVTSADNKNSKASIKCPTNLDIKLRVQTRSQVLTAQHAATKKQRSCTSLSGTVIHVGSIPAVNTSNTCIVITILEKKRYRARQNI
jgi:hypothetical protein